MKISHIKEAPLLRAYLLINQEKSKKNAFKSIQTEIAKMTEFFGTDFDRNLHLILFNDIDFKDPKTFQKSKDRKIEYFLQDFPQFIERPDFTEIFGRILMDTKNPGTANEIFNGLNKKFKLNIENQMKIIISFIMSETERYQEEARNILLEKCKEIYKDKKLANLTESTINTLLTILDLIKKEEGEDSGMGPKEIISQIDEFYQYFIDYEEDINSCQTSADDIKQISDLEKRLDTGNEEPVELEKIFMDLGPFICSNKIFLANVELIDVEIDVDRFGNFIIYMLNHQKVKMDEELKELNKLFLESLIKTSYSSQNSNNFNNMTKEEYKNLLEQNLNKEITWDLEQVYKLFKKNIDNMDVNQILNSLDNPLFCIKDKTKFDYLIEILKKLNILKEENEKNLDKFFKNLIFTKWNNEINQIEFIDFMINNEYVNENCFYSLKNYNGNKISEDIDNKILQKYSNNSTIKNQFLINNWKNIDIIEILLQLSKGEFYNSVKEIFKWPIQNIPEILSISLVNSNPDLDSFLYDELTFEVIQKVLMSKTNDKELVDELWNSNKNLIILVLAKMWKNQPDIQNMAKIFDIIKTKIPDTINILVNSRHYGFSVYLAIYAAKRDFLNLKKWFKERINKVDDEFIEAILSYIQKNLISQIGAGANNSLLENAQLSLESIAIILENVMRSCDSDKLSQKTKIQSQEIFKNIFELYEDIQMQNNNLEEIDKEVNQILDTMFKGEISVDNVVEKLINYHKSDNQKDVEKYLYIIKCLFDEYQFYPGYPEKELKNAAELFGKIINNQIMDGVLVTIALKYIFESIKTGKGTMYTFGIIALSQFINKISQWPNFMNSLIDVPQIKNEKELYQKLLKQFNESKKKEKGINSGDSRSEENECLIEMGDKNIDLGNGINELDKDETNMAKEYNKLKNKLSGPAKRYDNSNHENQNLISEEIINKINYIFCFSNEANIQEKIKDLKTIFKDDKKIKWFGQYFVSVLIKTENIQFFPKYYEIFDQLKNKELHKEIIKATIKTIIKNATGTCDTLSSENRTKECLKNLGLWLSEYKISKDRPILAKDLDFRILITSSCENGNLHLVVPFICCVFKYATNSKVFKPTNPWVGSILNLMAELNSNSQVEQGVKEEIKNLFKNLKADINTWPKTKELEKIHIKSSSPYYGQDVDKDKDFFYKKITELGDYINNLLGIFNSDPNISQRQYQRKNNSNNNNTNNDNNNYLSNSDVIKLLAEVMTNSIQEIIPDIIDKNVKSSIVTSISLVNKDFMFEKDENKYISSLENTMNFLAMSLSTMNAKELLKQNINAEFDKILEKKNLTKKTIEKIKQQPKSEFISIGLDYIQNFINKEAPKILKENSSVKEVLEKRRQSNINNNGGNNVFIDNKHYKDYIKVMKILPDKLHPNETCITDEEYKIYENFGKLFKSMNNSIKEENGRNSFLNTIYRILKEVLDNTAANKARIIDYDYCMKNIQNVIHKIDLNNDENDLICLEKIVSECKITDKKLELELAEKTLDYAISSIQNGNILWLNVYSHILKGWVTLNPEISEEIIKRLLNLEDIIMRYKFEIYHNFLKKKIIDYEKLDKYLVEILNKNGSDLLARDLFEKLYQKIKTPHPYYYGRNSKNYYALFTNKSQIRSDLLNILNTPFLNLKHNEQLYLGKFATLFLDYFTKLYLKNEDNKDLLNILKNEINEMKNDMAKSDSKNKTKMDIMQENNICKIILIICEMCIKGPLENQKNSLCFCCPDNLAICIYIIVLIQEKNKLKLFVKIMNYIISFFQKDYKKPEPSNFINQRGYFRFLYNLIYLLNKNQSEELFFDSEHKRINYLNVIVDFLKNNSPMEYPGFAMAWLELISCNIFISNYLEPPYNPPHQKKKDKGEKYEKYEKYLILLVELLNYLDSLNDKIISDYNLIFFLQQVYKFFFLLTNSYPEFISKYYYQLVTCLSGDSSKFVQLKNIILSAYPNNAPIIDIETGTFSSIKQEESKNDEENNNLINIKNTATISFDSNNALEKNEFKNYIDKYINEENENYLVILVKKLASIESEKEVNKICNMLILYWSQSKHKYNLNEKSIKSKEIIFKFFEFLLVNLSREHRDILIGALLNSLRFPCVQTLAYSNLFQELFLEMKNDEIREHMLNNLLTRIIYKPIPWGLKFTFINMNKNEKFQKLIKPYLDKYNLDDAFTNILNGCKKNDLKNLMEFE